MDKGNPAKTFWRRLTPTERVTLAVLHEVREYGLKYLAEDDDFNGTATALLCAAEAAKGVSTNKLRVMLFSRLTDFLTENPRATLQDVMVHISVGN